MIFLRWGKNIFNAKPAIEIHHHSTHYQSTCRRSLSRLREGPHSRLCLHLRPLTRLIAGGPGNQVIQVTGPYPDRIPHWVPVSYKSMERLFVRVTERLYLDGLRGDESLDR